MIKLFQGPQKTLFLAIFLMIPLIFAPSQALAQTCTVTLSSNKAITNKGINAQAEATKNVLKAEIKKVQTELVTRLELMRQQVVTAINGVSQAVTQSAIAISKSHAKATDALVTKQTELAKRLDAAEVARNAQPTSNDCVRATGAQYSLETKNLTTGVAKGLAKSYMAAYTGAGSDLSPTQAENSIRYQADVFRFVMANLCNPEMNGGLVPTQANPIQTTSGPLWCGMDRNAGEEALIDLHITLPTMLFEPSKLMDNPKARQTVMVAMQMLLGFPMDKMPVPKTASEQAAYVKRAQKAAKMAFPAQVLSNAFARIFPTVSNGGSEWTRGILLAGLPDEVLEQRQSKLEGNVSQSQFEQAMVEMYTDNQYFMNLQGMAQGGYDREVIALSSMLAYLQSERLKEAEISNMLSAAKYVAQIGG